MSIITWSGQAFYLLFADPENSKNFEDFFYGKVLKLEDGSGLDNLGVLQGELSLCLGIACIVIFILIAAGTKSVGKVSHFVLHCSATEIFHFSKKFWREKISLDRPYVMQYFVFQAHPLKKFQIIKLDFLNKIFQCVFLNS